MNWPKVVTLLSLVSVVLFAVTGVSWWAMLPDTPDGFLRALLLTVLHIGGLLAWPMYSDFRP